jgi:hypothetical protein
MLNLSRIQAREQSGSGADRNEVAAASSPHGLDCVGIRNQRLKRESLAGANRVGHGFVSLAYKVARLLFSTGVHKCTVAQIANVQVCTHAQLQNYIPANGQLWAYGHLQMCTCAQRAALLTAAGIKACVRLFAVFDWCAQVHRCTNCERAGVHTCPIAELHTCKWAIVGL